MFDFENYKDKLLNDIGKKRFAHSLRVCDTAIALNKNFNIDLEKVKEASLLHDCAKYREDYYYNKYKDKYYFDEEIIENKSVFHAFLGVVVAKEEYNIKDEDVLNAIKYHTTGRSNMTDLEKIVFLADAIEPKRDYEGVKKLRELAKKDIDKAILYSLNETIKHLIDKNVEICSLTLDARNFLIKEKDD